MSSSICWVHLSDWHQTGEDFDRQIVSSALFDDISQRTKISDRLSQVDFVVFSGDLAFHGRQEEFKAAGKNLLDPLVSAIGFEKDGLSRVFVTPGNHDINRDAFKFGPSNVAQEMRDRRKVSDWLTQPRSRQVLLQPFEEYSTFVRAYLGDRQDFEKNEPAYGFTRSLGFEFKKLSVICLNSAWFSGRNKGAAGHSNDYGSLMLGEAQLQLCIDQSRDSDFRIAVMHHPFDWFAETERVWLEERLSKECDFVLVGHQHFPQIRVSFSPTGNLVVMPAGACYNRRVSTDARYCNAYGFTHLDFESGLVTVYLRRWSDRRHRWVADEESAEDGQFEFALPRLAPAKLEVSVAIIIKDNKVLLVRRREKVGNLHWQFPGGLVTRKGGDIEAARREALDEANVICNPKRKVGQRIHPETKALVHYWLCDYTGGLVKVRDRKDLDMAEWVDLQEALNRITSDIHPEIRRILSSP